MVTKFGIDEHEVQAVDERDRLKRPIAVAIFGTMISLATVAGMLSRSGGQNGEGEVGLIGFGILACMMSCAYAWIGARHSKALANRLLGIVGAFVALAGVGIVLWLLLAYAP